MTVTGLPALSSTTQGMDDDDDDDEEEEEEEEEVDDGDTVNQPHPSWTVVPGPVPHLPSTEE